MSNKLNVTSWADRFAIMDHFKPGATQSCSLFNVTPDELTTAQELRAAGTFAPTKNIDMNQYSQYFTAHAMVDSIPSGATTFTKPETANKKFAAPQKRGRKGSNIKVALHAVPSQPVTVDSFMKQHGVSLAVLRQAK